MQIPGCEGMQQTNLHICSTQHQDTRLEVSGRSENPRGDYDPLDEVCPGPQGDSEEGALGAKGSYFNREGRGANK